jgi:hypothetical protein
MIKGSHFSEETRQKLMNHIVTEETKQKQREANSVHGHNNNHSRSPTYNSWRNMRGRCSNPNSWDWKYYGGRGIKVCERWNDFRNFLEDMGERPTGMTLDRKENNGNYEPLNCRWADSKTQSTNKFYHKEK